MYAGRSSLAAVGFGEPTTVRSRRTDSLPLKPLKRTFPRAFPYGSETSLHLRFPRKKRRPARGDVSFCGSHPSATSSSIISAKNDAKRRICFMNPPVFVLGAFNSFRHACGVPPPSKRESLCILLQANQLCRQKAFFLAGAVGTAKVLQQNGLRELKCVKHVTSS